MNNERQLYLSLHMYCDDNKDNLPYLTGGAVKCWDIPVAATDAMLSNGCKRRLSLPQHRAEILRQRKFSICQLPVELRPAGFNITGYTFAFNGPSSKLEVQYQNKNSRRNSHHHRDFQLCG